MVTFRLICFFYYLHICLTSKLNVPRILLPYNSKIPVNYTLVADGGCYKWSSSRNDVALVEPINPDPTLKCSSQAVVSGRSKLPHKATAIISAEDERTGEKLTCSAIVDAIDNIQIVTTTKELYLEEAPESFEVAAFDKQGNEFTCLSGITFNWQLETDTDQEDVINANEILRFLTYSESPYETPAAIEELEKKGLRGHTVLIEAMKMGSAKVSVSLSDPSYKLMKSGFVSIDVVANIMLDPPAVYMLPQTQVNFKLLQIKQGTLHEIPLPNSQYTLEVENTNILQLLDDGFTGRALEIGSTEVVLKYKNMKTSSAMHLPSTQVFVVNASYLTCTALPYKSWTLISGMPLEVVIEVFDRENNKILVNDNVIVNTVLPKNHFSIEESSVNGTYHQGFVTEPGSSKMKAILKYVENEGIKYELKPSIKCTADVEIYQNVAITPEIVVYPWDPITKPTYDIILKASGGDGRYQWSSSDTSLATVTQTGSVHTLGEGYAEISLVQVKAPYNAHNSHVYVVPAVELKILPGIVEYEAGQLFYLHIAVFGEVMTKDGVKSRRLFNDCSQLKFKVESTDKKNFLFEKVEMDNGIISCALIAIKTTGVGSAKITVSYELRDLILKDAVTVSTFTNLHAVSPLKQTVLPIGSSKKVVFEGGPRPWILKPSSFYSRVESKNTSVIGFTDAREKQSERYSYEVVCHHLGETTLVLRVGNSPSTSNPKPVSSYSEITIICAMPNSIYVRAEVKRPNGNHGPCPVDSSGRIISHNDQDLDLIVTVKDKEGRKFDNISSLEVAWNLSDIGLGKFKSDSGILTKKKPDISDGLIYYQIFSPSGKSGLLDIKAIVIGFNKTVLEHWNIDVPSLDFVSSFSEYDESHSDISYIIELELAGDAYIDPKKASVFNHPSNKVFLKVHEGSGFYVFEIAAPNVASVSYHSNNHSLEIIPMQDGSSNVKLFDLCLVSYEAASTDIEVSGLHSIDVQLITKIERGKKVLAYIRIYDALGHRLPHQSLKLLDINSVSNSDIISIEENEEPSEVDADAIFTVHGIQLGETPVQFEAKVGKMVIRSSSITVQVFSPLQLKPKVITIVKGNIFQLSTSGGPQPDVDIQYVISNTTVGEVASNGVIYGAVIGTATVTGQALGYDNALGEVVLYSQDSVVVNVICLSGVKIHIPINRIKTNSDMPMYVKGLDEYQTPFTFGSSDPALQIKWSLNNQEIGSIYGIYHNSGIQESVDNQFAVRFRSRNPGQTTVTVKISSMSTKNCCHQICDCRVLEDEVHIYVFDELEILNMKHPGSKLLMTPNTELKLQTNRDNAASVTYSIMKDCGNPKSSLTDLTIDDKGVIKSFENTGHAIVVVVSQENYGFNQTLMVHVEVKHFSFLMLSSTTSVLASDHSHLQVVPVGVMLTFIITFHDHVGDVFHSVCADLKYRPSRFDLVSIEPGISNYTLHMRAMKPGQTVLKVWEATNSRINDYISVISDWAVFPSQPTVSVGDIICFTSPLRNPDGRTGVWTSEDTRVLDVHPTYGVAIAKEPGYVTMKYSVGSDIVTKTEVKIEPVLSVVITSPYDYLSSAPRGSPYIFPVSIASNDGKMGNILGTNCSSEAIIGAGFSLPFVCDLTIVDNPDGLDVKTAFHVVTGYDAQSGMYLCEVTPLAGNTTDDRFSLLTTDLKIQATILPSRTQIEITSNSLYITYLPHFTIYQKEVSLSNQDPINFIAISANPMIMSNLTVTPSHDDYMEVLPAESDAHNQDVMLFPVKLKDRYWSVYALDHTLSVKIYSQLIQQLVMVPVITTPIGDKDDIMTCARRSEKVDWSDILLSMSFWGVDILGHMSSWIFTVLFLVLLAVIFYLVYQAIVAVSIRAFNQHFAMLPGRQSEHALRPDDQYNRSPTQTISRSPPRRSYYDADSPPIYGSPPMRRLVN